MVEISDNLWNICEKVIESLSDICSGLEEYLAFFHGCVNEGIVPPMKMYVDDGIIIPENMGGRIAQGVVSSKNLEYVLEFLNNFSHSIHELSEMVSRYKFDIEAEMQNKNTIEYISKAITQDKWILSMLDYKICEINSDWLESVLYDGIYVVDYWCRQKWMNGRGRISLEDVQLFMGKLNNLIPLLHILTQSIERHLHEYSKLEGQISMACVYAPPEMMNAAPIEEADNLQERIYPFSLAGDLIE